MSEEKLDPLESEADESVSPAALAEVDEEEADEIPEAKPKKTSGRTKEAIRVRNLLKNDRIRGRKLDETFLPRVIALEAHIRETYTEEEDLSNALEFLYWYSTDFYKDPAKRNRNIFRELYWRKSGLQNSRSEEEAEELYERDRLKSFEFQRYTSVLYIDAAVHQLLSHTRLFQLTPDLTAFYIESLEEAMRWFKRNPGDLEDVWLKEIEEEIALRKSGKKIPLTPRPEPKPETKLVKEPDGELYWKHHDGTLVPYVTKPKAQPPQPPEPKQPETVWDLSVEQLIALQTRRA